MIQVRWTGAAGLEFCYDDTTFLVDPYYTRSGKKDVFFGRIKPDQALIEKQVRRLERISAILVTHTHFDHALDIPSFASACSAKVFGSESLRTLMSLYGLSDRVQVCGAGDEVMVDPDVHAVMLPSVHGRILFGKVPFEGEIEADLTLPLKASDYRVGQVFAPKIRIRDTVFLHVGSAGFIEAALHGHRCDVLFLCVPGWKKQAGYPEKIIEMTRPHTVVLFHHDNFFKPINKDKAAKYLYFQGIDTLKHRIKSVFPSVDLRCPSVFEPMFF